MNKNLGGKANSLIKLREKNFNVPDFFVIDSSEYIEFLKFNSLYDKIKELANQKKYSLIKKLIINANFSDSLETKIEENFTKLDSNLVSVRSSALNEDGLEKSFAGQYNTFLNVTLKELEDKIKLCWCSLYEENVLSYSKEQNLYGMCVIIQKMINPEYAGVAFSVDPTNDLKNYSIIEIVKGLGEQLVSGTKTPTKFLVRRETKRIDLKIGQISIDDEIITNLEQIILNIENLYSTYVDIEYAIYNKQIYILQARPITSITTIKKAYKLAITRPHSLIELEIYYKGEYEGISKLTNNLYYFKPLFIYNSENENIVIYYNNYDLEEDPRLMYLFIEENFNKINNYYNVKQDIIYLKNCMAKGLSIDFNNFLEKIINLYPFTSLGQLAGHYDNITTRVKDLFLDYRYNYDSICHDACEYLIEKLKELLPQEYQKFINYLTISEILNNRYPSLKQLEKRKKGFILFDKLYVTKDYDKWLIKHNINIEEEIEQNNSNYLQGQIAYPGNVSGKVFKVYSEKDFKMFEDGDIVVTPMTTPKFVAIIKRSSAIITDEGGITCHASIIARELKIPCIVGCKNATKVLKNNDFIQIEGNLVYIKNK